MIISIHMPKTAGLSFRELLRAHFKLKMREDYVDFPDNKTLKQRVNDVDRFRKRLLLTNLKYIVRGVECVHGHFLPYKFTGLLGFEELKYITWLREPSERLASHYYYWFRTYNKDASLPFHKKVVEERWSLEAFCFSEEMQNLYHQFLWKFPKENLDFIGVTEFMDEDLRFFCSTFLKNTSLVMKTVNTNTSKTQSSYFDDPLFVERIKEYHALDYELYNFALNKRNTRL